MGAKYFRSDDILMTGVKMLNDSYHTHLISHESLFSYGFIIHPDDKISILKFAPPDEWK